MSRLSRADAVSVNLTHPLVVSADLTRQVLVSLHRNGRVSCRCMRASGLLPIPPSPATLLAGWGFHRG